MDLIYCMLAAVGSPFLLYKFVRDAKFRSGLLNKLKPVPERTGKAPCLWVHCVSVGEARTARGLIARFREDFPAWDVVISTGTTTGAKVAREENPDLLVFHLPLDVSWMARSAVERIRPDCLVLVELELWPNLLRAARDAGTRVVVVNGRIRRRSERAYRLLSFCARGLFVDGCVQAYCMQNELYAGRLARLGVCRSRIYITGTMKYDNVRTSVDAARQKYFRRIFAISRGDVVIVGGSTYRDEEEALTRTFATLRNEFRRLRLVLAPRHVERAGEAVAAAEKAGLRALRRSTLGEDGRAEREAVIVLDTVGELGDVYGLADCVFVGKSLFESMRGGHNVLEPAAMAKPVLFGPYMENFAEEAELLLDADGAARVEDEAGLLGELRNLLSDPDRRRKMGVRAREAIASKRGATEKTLDILKEVILNEGSLR